MLNDTSSLLSHLQTRRSAKPKEMEGTRPNAEDLAAMAELALRTPDHGKLVPFRYLIVEDDRRDAFAAMLRGAFKASNPTATDSQCETAARPAMLDAALIVAIYSPDLTSKIPAWEQQLSCGASVMNLLHAVHAHGFLPGWVTPWACFDDGVAAALGLSEHERLAGFIFVGTAGQKLEERPRPDPADRISTWRA